MSEAKEGSSPSNPLLTRGDLRLTGLMFNGLVQKVFGGVLKEMEALDLAVYQARGKETDETKHLRQNTIEILVDSCRLLEMTNNRKWIPKVVHTLDYLRDCQYGTALSCDELLSEVERSINDEEAQIQLGYAGRKHPNQTQKAKIEDLQRKLALKHRTPEEQLKMDQFDQMLTQSDPKPTKDK